MTRISPSAVVDPSALEYQAKGEVVRVFDQNVEGELIPVEFNWLADTTKFQLSNLPFGTVHAEWRAK